MLKLLKTALYTALILGLFGCGNNFQTERFYAMGTFVSVTLSEKDFKHAQDIRAEITKLENIVKDSTKQANETQSFIFTGLMEHLYTIGQDFNRLTRGHFSIFAYTLSSLYGFPEGPYRVPTEKELEIAIDETDRMQNVKMDMGAYAKGYIVDKAIGRLMLENVNNALINAGGDLYAMGKRGQRDWRIAIKHPETDSKVLSVIRLSDRAVATSGDYERFFVTESGEKIFHIFDTVTGKNPAYYSSVSVISDRTVTADGLATAFFLLPIEDIKVRCESMNTPTLLYTREKETIKLCGWEKFEDN